MQQSPSTVHPSVPTARHAQRLDDVSQLPAQQSADVEQLPPTPSHPHLPFDWQLPEQHVSPLHASPSFPHWHEPDTHAWPAGHDEGPEHWQAPFTHALLLGHAPEHVPPQPSGSPHDLPVHAGWHAQVPPVQLPLQQSVSFVQTAELARHAQVPDWQTPVQHPRTSWQPPPMGEQTQTPALQSPEQQLALLVQSDDVPLQSAQMPAAQTPLQHSEPVWQLSAAALQSHVPPLHTPLQQDDSEHFAPSRPQPPPASTAASGCGKMIRVEPSIDASGPLLAGALVEELQAATAAIRARRTTRRAELRRRMGSLDFANRAAGALRVGWRVGQGRGGRTGVSSNVRSAAARSSRSRALTTTSPVRSRP